MATHLANSYLRIQYDLKAFNMTTSKKSGYENVAITNILMYRLAFINIFRLLPRKIYFRNYVM